MAEAFCPHCMKDIPAEAAVCPFCGKETEIRSEAHQIPAGRVLHAADGRAYLIGKVKGEGGFGITYIAKERASGEVVAVKEFFPLRCQPQRLPDLGVRPAANLQEIYDRGKQSFLSEASMLRAVRNIRSVVHVRDYFETNGTAYMVMEYLNGTTLKELMETQTRFEPVLLFRKVLPLMRDVAKLHDAGVLHRDIAPDNIMLMPDGSLKLLDFGCARSMEDGKSMTVALKPGFAPLEQYQTRGQGPYTDIYALCATLYYCLSGRIPPAAPERLMAEGEGKGDPLVPLSALGVNVTLEQERVLLWGLEIQPMRRPQKMEDVIRRLEFDPRPEPRPDPDPKPDPVPPRPDLGPKPDPVPPPSAAGKLKAFWETNKEKCLIGLLVAAGLLILLLR